MAFDHTRQIYAPGDKVIYNYSGGCILRGWILGTIFNAILTPDGWLYTVELDCAVNPQAINGGRFVQCGGDKLVRG